MPSLGYGDDTAAYAAAKARRERLERKRVEAWERMKAAFAAARI